MIAKMEDKEYQRLWKEIDERMPIGFPSSKNHLEIEILKHIFCPEEDEIVIHLSILPELTNLI